MAIKNTALTTSAQSIYTSSGNSVVTTIHLCNYSGSPVQANIYAVPNGSTANLSTIIYGNVTVGAYNTLIVYQEKFVLANGDQIDANVSANAAVTATVSTMGF